MRRYHSNDFYISPSPVLLSHGGECLWCSVACLNDWSITRLQRKYILPKYPALLLIWTQNQMSHFHEVINKYTLYHKVCAHLSISRERRQLYNYYKVSCLLSFPLELRSLNLLQHDDVPVNKVSTMKTRLVRMNFWVLQSISTWPC